MIQRYIPTFSEFDGYKGMLPGEDDGYGRSYVLFADHQQALSALEEQLRLRNLQREASVETERKDCIRALTALSAAGVCTPEETYGTNSSWAIGDLCKALAAAQTRIAELEKAVTTYKHRHESGGPLSKLREDSCQCSACDQARAALGVNTK